MTSNESARRLATRWLVCPTGLPLIRRRCLNCPSARYRAHGKFRVNANHKLLDVWLLALCVGCGETIKLTVLERVHVRTIDPSTLDRFHDNDPGLAATLLADPGLSRRNGVALDWDGSWELRKTTAGVPDADVIDTSVHFVQRIPLRLTRLLAVGLDVSRSEVQRLVAGGDLSSARRLTGRSSSDFSFTLRRRTVAEHRR
ncbi:DUF1062 domain-containing protein [Actinoplanes sp. NEAU-A12]|uniref:DUF1062 domain-containing protein n=1 Tax=Actinoplanes sandaracinus TaxID=3045177 RepID=A0ABT6WQU2_9ACTN|nr:DUF1062 domain-containing protein [Actinoplanes sandaracinus]MDI6102094.1 DUF1062 domain-containing protein [Actinoplanes sandaracinus]